MYSGDPGDEGSIPRSKRPSREGNGNPLQYSCLENPMDRVTWRAIVQFSSVQSFSSVLFATPWTAARQLPEFIQTHVHWVGDAIQSSHPLSSPSPPALNLSQHQGLFKWVSSSHQVAKVLEFQLQHQSFQWKLRATVHGIAKSQTRLSTHAHSFTKLPNPSVIWVSHLWLCSVSTHWPLPGSYSHPLPDQLPCPFPKALLSHLVPHEWEWHGL